MSISCSVVVLSSVVTSLVVSWSEVGSVVAVQLVPVDVLDISSSSAHDRSFSSPSRFCKQPKHCCKCCHELEKIFYRILLYFTTFPVHCTRFTPARPQSAFS